MLGISLLCVAMGLGVGCASCISMCNLVKHQSLGYWSCGFFSVERS